MGASALLLRVLDANITWSIGVEIDPVKRAICDNVNPPNADKFGGVDHTWNTDVYDITRESIELLGVGNIAILDVAAPCKDFSPLKLLPSKFTGKPGVRPGMQGKHGQVLAKCLEIVAWVVELNPKVEVFCENVCFDDMPHDWDIMNRVLGPPMVLDAADFSYTRRRRAYWTRNMVIPELDEDDLCRGFKPGKADRCMGRSESGKDQ